MAKTKHLPKPKPLTAKMGRGLKLEKLPTLTKGKGLKKLPRSGSSSY